MHYKSMITDWIPFKNPSVFETVYRRVGNRVEVFASWAEATDLYDFTLPKSVELDLELHKIESIWPRGLNIRLDSIRKHTPRVELLPNPFIGPRYIKTVEWGSDAEVVAWATNVVVAEGVRPGSDVVWEVPKTGWYTIGDSGEEIFLEKNTKLQLVTDSVNGTRRLSSEEKK